MEYVRYGDGSVWYDKAISGYSLLTRIVVR